MVERPVAGGKFPRIEDALRQARSLEDMEEEAGMYRGLLERLEGERP